MAFNIKKASSSLKSKVTKKDTGTKKKVEKSTDVVTELVDEVRTSVSATVKKVSKKLPHKTLVYVVAAVIAVVVIFFVSMSVSIYKYKSEDSFTRGVASVVPFPAAVVNGAFITYSEYLDQLLLLKKYQIEFKKVDFKSEDGKKVLAQVEKDSMDRLVEDELVKTQAKKLKVTIDKKEVNEQYDALIKSNGGPETFANILKQYYGLTAEQYKVQVYESRLFKQKVAEKFAADESVNTDSKTKAEQVLAEVKAGGDFADLAKKYSQDSTASVGGDLGYFSKGKMVPEFESAAFALKSDEVSSLVKTVYGYHIIKVTDVKDDQVKASHILIKTKDFNLWLEESRQSAKIKYYIKVNK